MEVPYRFKHNTSSFAHYWNNGIGKELLDQLGFVPDLDQAQAFIPLLYHCDKIGDKVIEDLYNTSGFYEANASLIRHLNGYPNPDKANRVWNEFFATFEISPAWLDREKLKYGAELSRRAGLSALIVLRDYCLMGGYESAAINKPLIFTGALKRGAVKRLRDTVEFWVQITKENALEKGNEGFKKVMQTRMIHSFSRVSILSKTDWDSNRWGLPINTWDMLATNLGFSLVFLVGLRKVGIIPSKEEVEGLFHYWKYIGYLLGIPLEIIPENELEAIEAMFYWTMTQREGDEDTKTLAHALMEEPILANYPKNALMRKMMREIHLYYNEFFLGEYSCDLLGLPKTTIGQFARINIWKTRREQAKIVDEETRQHAIQNGGKEQEQVRKIYQRFNNV